MPSGGHGLPLSAGVLLVRKPCMLGVARDRQRPTMSPRGTRGLGNNSPLGPPCRPVSLKAFVLHVGSIRPPAGKRRRRSRPGRATAAAAGRREPRRQMAPRSSGSAAPARRRARRVAAHRSSPFGCAARQQPPTATLEPNDGSGEVFPPCSVTQRREFTRLGSSWPVVISLPEWLLLAGRLSRDSGAYSVTTWVTRRSDSGRLGKEIGPDCAHSGSGT